MPSSMTGYRRPRPHVVSTPRPRPWRSGSNASAQAVSMVCAIAPALRSHRQAKPRSPPTTPSKRCAASGRTQYHIAIQLGLSRATVSRILSSRGLSLLTSIEPAVPRPRYERATPGEIIHIDIKKLGKFDKIGHRILGDSARTRWRGRAGWEFVHVAIDDHSRVARIDIFPDERRPARSLS